MKTVWLFPRNLFRFHHACDEGSEKNQKQPSVWKWFHVIIVIASERLNGNSIEKLLIAIAESWGCGLWLIWKCIICVVHGTPLMRSFSLPLRFNPLEANPSRLSSGAALPCGVDDLRGELKRNFHRNRWTMNEKMLGLGIFMNNSDRVETDSRLLVFLVLIRVNDDGSWLFTLKAWI